ncbi:MAG TPA: methyltransferase domain-containing protein [Candidatus Portnoybacteria bacterium]|nr:methyltransferase domain-containing protein [Candidatus Portnoybacteria bacterium]
MEDFISKIRWQCPKCGNPLIDPQKNEQCSKCGQSFKVQDNCLDFLSEKSQSFPADKNNRLKDFFKRWPGFYYFMVYVLGPVFIGLSAKSFIKKYSDKEVVLNLGSGPRIISSSAVNLDLCGYSGVKIVADILHLPIADNSIGAIVCDTVVEHIRSPKQMVDEIRRVLISRGTAYFAFPFMYPFHASPDDFYRWTKAGFLELVKDFEVVEFGVRSGIFSSLAINCCYLFSSLFSFGSRSLYWLLVNLFMLLFFPIKLLDFLFFWLPFNSDAAAIMYCVVRKR